MCGINGIYQLSSNSINLKSDIINMNKILAHRGPDDNGVWINKNKNLGFGQTRLSIIDLSKSGHQPMHDNLGNNTIIYNGEIYNYKLLNKKFLKDEFLKSTSDTETILNFIGELV